MEIQNYLTYIAVDIFCIASSFIILLKIDRSYAIESEYLSFKAYIIAFILYAISDSLTCLGNTGLIPFPWILNVIVNGLDLFFLGLLCYTWFIYSHMCLNITYIKSLRTLLLAGLPIALSAFLCLCSVKTGWMYEVSPDGVYSRGGLYWIQVTINYMYYTASIVFSSICYFTSSDRMMRKKASSIIRYIIFPVTAGVAQILIPGTPIISMCVFIPTFLLFLRFQQMHIFKDSLTGMNNRRRAETFLEQIIENASDINPYYFFIFDINKFKLINDNYGHLEGDIALQYSAECIKSYAKAVNGFAARYGGDEFILISSVKMISNPDQFINNIGNKLHRLCIEKNLNYEITLSAGYSIFDSPDADILEILDQADQMLYENKSVYHSSIAS